MIQFNYKLPEEVKILFTPLENEDIMELKFEKRKNNLIRIKSFDLNEIKQYAKKNGLVYVDCYMSHKEGKKYYIVEYKNP